jgi:hypothetical protein
MMPLMPQHLLKWQLWEQKRTTSRQRATLKDENPNFNFWGGLGSRVGKSSRVAVIVCIFMASIWLYISALLYSRCICMLKKKLFGPRGCRQHFETQAKLLIIFCLYPRSSDTVFWMEYQFLMVICYVSEYAYVMSPKSPRPRTKSDANSLVAAGASIYYLDNARKYHTETQVLALIIHVFSFISISICIS